MRYWRLLLAGMVVAGCDPVVHAQGVVRDSNGVGIPAATVTVWLADDPRMERVRTDSTGHFTLSRFGSTEGRVVLQACHSRYGLAQQVWDDERQIPDSVELILRGRPFSYPLGGC